MSELDVPYRLGEKASFKKTITDKDVQSFAELVGDVNPVHLDEEYAAQTRFKGRIVHGALVAGLISTVLGNSLPGPGAVYLSQKTDFIWPVRLGDMVTATVEVVDIRADKPVITLRTYCVNQNGKTVIDGEAVVLIEGKRSEIV